MAKYKREVTEYLLDRVDIVDVIGSVVALKKAGRNHKGLCPFHSEKTPSFVVSQDKQFYHCFGCGQSGSAIGFIMESENIGFLDALESLAERYGVDLSPFLSDRDSLRHYDNTAKLYDVMKQVARYYFNQLSDNRVAQQYLQRRGIARGTARAFGLGFARDSWDDIIKLAQRAGFSQRELLDCGLLSKNERARYYDRFRNRLMFPIFDRRGRVVAFGGRVLDDALPKYLNSPETAIFHKSNILYGLNFARKNLNKQKSVILVEGYIDVITLHQHGFKNAVASLGTALTEHHVKQLDRIYDEVVFAYDGDGAGRAAIMKSLQVFQGANLTVRIVDMGQYKDPDEVLQNVAADGFNDMIAAAQDTITFALDHLQQGFQIDAPDGRLAYLKEVFAYIAARTLQSERQIYIEKLAERLKLNAKSVANDYKQWHRDNAKPTAQRSSDSLPPDVTAAPPEAAAVAPKTKLYRVEQALLAGLLQGAIGPSDFAAAEVTFFYDALAGLAEALLAYFKMAAAFDIEAAIDHFSLEQLQLIEEIQQIKDDWQGSQTFPKMLLTQRRLMLLERRKQIDTAIKKQSIMSGDVARIELTKLQTKRKKIQAKIAEINRQFKR